MENEPKIQNNNSHPNKAHRILAHSYSVYFVLFLIGVTLDLLFGVEFFSSAIMLPIGITLLVLSTLLILWAQFSTRNMASDNVSKESFSKGPYRFSRHPTHWGLFFLILGFGIMVNATFVILSTLISFIISKFVFVKKQEAVLAERYGAPYIEYKKSVKL